jgi:hypothetical protein
VLNKTNAFDQTLNLTERGFQAPREGFGSVLPSHPRIHEIRSFATENRTFYGTGRAITSDTLLQQAARLRMAGTMTRPLD